jgi:hypothetical protein
MRRLLLFLSVLWLVPSLAWGQTKTDGATFTPGSDKVNMQGCMVDEVTPASVAEGKAGKCRMSPYGAQHIQLTDSAGNEIVIPTAGLTHYVAATASTNAANVKASAGTVYHIAASNLTSTVYYLRMYNLATSPTCSSSTGFIETIPIPASTAVGGRERETVIGQAFTTGVAYCITGGPNNNDNTNAAVGVYVTIIYK